jgi:hypothetical protein
MRWVNASSLIEEVRIERQEGLYSTQIQLRERSMQIDQKMVNHAPWLVF